jgi:hypothetical protein
MDSHVYPDYVVPPSYDSLLGKVCQITIPCSSLCFWPCDKGHSCYYLNVIVFCLLGAYLHSVTA